MISATVTTRTRTARGTRTSAACRSSCSRRSLVVNVMPSRGRTGRGGHLSRASDAAVIAESIDRPAMFGTIFDRHATVVHRYLVRRLGPDDAEAITGEVFRIAFERRAAFDPERAGDGARDGVAPGRGSTASPRTWRPSTAGGRSAACTPSPASPPIATRRSTWPTTSPPGSTPPALAARRRGPRSAAPGRSSTCSCSYAWERLDVRRHRPVARRPRRHGALAPAPRPPAPARAGSEPRNHRQATAQGHRGSTVSDLDPLQPAATGPHRTGRPRRPGGVLPSQGATHVHHRRHPRRASA